MVREARVQKASQQIQRVKSPDKTPREKKEALNPGGGAESEANQGGAGNQNLGGDGGNRDRKCETKQEEKGNGAC